MSTGNAHVMHVNSTAAARDMLLAQTQQHIQKCKSSQITSMASCPIHRYTLAHLVVGLCRKFSAFSYVNSQCTCHTCQQHTLSLTCAAASWRRRPMSLSIWRAWSASCLTTSRMPVRTSGFSRLLCTWKISPQACTKSSCTAARVRASPSRLAPAPDDKLHCTQPHNHRAVAATV